MFSFKFSSKSPWFCSVWLKSRVLQLTTLLQELLHVRFLFVSRTTTLPHSASKITLFVDLVKKFFKPLLQKVKQRFLTEKKFIINLLKINDKNKLGVVRLNQRMSKLQTLSKCFQLQKFPNNAKNFWTCWKFLKHHLKILYL